MLRMCQEWSLQDSTFLRSSRTEPLHGVHGLKLRTEGYAWFTQHKQDSNYIKITKTGEFKSHLEDLSAIWIVPSSNTKSDNFKASAKKRFAMRSDPSLPGSFEEFLQLRSSCWIIEEKGKQYFCDCYNGIKGKLCKHSVGIMYKTKTLLETEDVRSQPLGQKRRRGRPKKLSHCLANSPTAAVPVASYHQPSPDVSSVQSRSNQPDSSSPVLPASAQRRPDPTTPSLSSPLQTLARQASVTDTPSACPLPPLSSLPAATRKSRAGKKRKVDVGALSPNERRVLRPRKIVKY